MYSLNPLGHLAFYGWSMMLVAVATSGCDPKPVSEIPSISGQKAPDHTDRSTPDASTIMTILDLLEPRGTDIERLDRQRNEFQSRIRILLPKPSEQQANELDTLVRWHRLYTRRLREHDRTLRTAREQADAIYRPTRGFQVTINEDGVAKRCRLPPPRPADPTVGPPNLRYEIPEPTECKVQPGYAQFDYQLNAASAELRSVLEAQWHLIQRIEKVRERLQSNQTLVPSTAPSP